MKRRISPTLTQGAGCAHHSNSRIRFRHRCNTFPFPKLHNSAHPRYAPGVISLHPGQDALHWKRTASALCAIQNLVMLSSRRPIKPCGVTPHGDGAVGRPRNRFRNAGRSLGDTRQFAPKTGEHKATQRDRLPFSVIREQWLKRWQCRFLIYEPVTSPDAAQFIGGRVTCASTESQAERSSNGPRPSATFLTSSAVVYPRVYPRVYPHVCIHVCIHIRTRAATTGSGSAHPVPPHLRFHSDRPCHPERQNIKRSRGICFFSHAPHRIGPATEFC